VPPNVAERRVPVGSDTGAGLRLPLQSFFAFQTLNNGDTVVRCATRLRTAIRTLHGVLPDAWNGAGSFVVHRPGGLDHHVEQRRLRAARSVHRKHAAFVRRSRRICAPEFTLRHRLQHPHASRQSGTPTNPAIFCQFVFDITTFYDPNKKVDAGIGGKTKVFNDVVVAIRRRRGVCDGKLARRMPPRSLQAVRLDLRSRSPTVRVEQPATPLLMTCLPAATGLNWSISPAYSGPGTCAITGAVGNQLLNCSFGNVGPIPRFSLHVLSPSSSVGPVTNSATIVAANQQLLSIASITVQPVTAAFSGLTQSQAIPVGTSAVTLGGIIGGGNSFPVAGETVSVTINGVAHPATIGTGGAFSLSFPTTNIPASATPYPITYSFAGDSIFGAASDSSTALTVNATTGSFTLTVS